MLYYMARRVILFRTEHTGRTFVEKVDFITAAGITPESVYRQGGPTLVVTPKAVLSWDREGREWVLAAVNSGSSAEDVQESTGFSLQVPSPVKMTPPPTEHELLLLRSAVKEKLQRIYPDFTEKKILPR